MQFINYLMNNQQQRKFTWKALLLIAAICIAFASLWYTNTLVKSISTEEKKKVEIWAEATKQLVNPIGSDQDYEFLFKIIRDNETVPAILVDGKKQLISFKNIDSTLVSNSRSLEKKLLEMQNQHKPIEFTIEGGGQNFIYYEDSYLLTQLKYYPYVQLGIIFLFIIASYLAFNAERKSEQNQVWVGLARETAHQLGTPISSLMAWLEYLKLKNQDDEISKEIEKDVNRLMVVADRFSKIGSSPKLEKINIVFALQNSIDYMKIRSSEKVVFTYTYPVHGVMAEVNESLLQWVIENIFKNAIDAMKGSGKIDVNVFVNENEWVIIDIKDNGKGIKRNSYKTIFEPGYTTKKTGWGLGLSLAKRIIEGYHSGKIYVMQSEVDIGTTFRVELKRV